MIEKAKADELAPPMKLGWEESLRFLGKVFIPKL